MQEELAGSARPASPSKKIRISRKTAVLLALLALLAITGIAYLLRRGAEAATVEPALQTAKVRKGDLVVTASGAGTVLPAAEVEMAFRSAGVLTELNVSAGDAVKSADVLARLESNIQNESDFQALFTTEGVTRSQLAMLEAETALADAENAVIYLIGSDAWYWEERMAVESATTAEIEAARQKRDYFLGLRDVDNLDLAQARADLETTRVALQDARAALEIVRAGPEALMAPLASLGAEMARLEQARLDVESTRLTAPFDGKVTSLNAVVGATVGTSPVLSLASTDDLLVRFYLDETDVDKAAAGRSVTFTFDAYPDQPLEGEVIRVEPSLQIVDGTPVVVVWAKLPKQATPQIMPGMTVEAEVIAGKASDALIVPIQALRELSPGSYAVFVVQPDGTLSLTPVSAGLRDYASVEIVSGLQAGDVVSTGNVETK